MNKRLWYFFVVLLLVASISFLYNEAVTISGYAVSSGNTFGRGMDSDFGDNPKVAGYALLGAGTAQVNGNWVSGVTRIFPDSCDEQGNLVENYIVKDTEYKLSGYQAKSAVHNSVDSGPGACVYKVTQVVLKKSDRDRMLKGDIEKLTLVKKKSSAEYIYTINAAEWVNDYSSSTTTLEGLTAAVATLQEKVMALEKLFQCNDGKDNDSDGKIDFSTHNTDSDSGCAGMYDNDESLEGTQ